MQTANKSENEILRQGIRRAVDRAGERSRRIVLSSTIPFDTQDVLTVLTHPADRKFSRVYWEQSSRQFAVAGLNSTITLNLDDDQSPEAVNQQMMTILDDMVCAGDEPAGGIRFLGGFAFDTSAELDETWLGFPRGRFILPECQVTRSGDQSWLTITRLVSAEDTPSVIEKEFSQTCTYYRNRLPVTLPPIRGVSLNMGANVPDKEAYAEIIYSILSALKPGRLEKAVLSRSSHLQMDGEFSVVSAIQVLRNTYPQCTNFFFSFPDEGTFFGSTPERLVQKKGNEIVTEALAGTAPRGRNMEEDRQLAEALLESHKEREEHEFVVEEIRSKLANSVTNLAIQETPDILKLKNVQHLRTPISGYLSNGRNVLDLASQLHPTPAVAGTPSDNAMKLIRKVEKQDRGWYSGPVGWLNRKGDGEFMVALRSALVREDVAHVFAGGGIVSESVPEKEWEETELKMLPIISALSGGQI